MYFRNYRLWKTSSDHCVKSAISEHALRVNMWKCPKYSQNLPEITFIMCDHNFERSSFGKCLPYQSVKSWGCFLTHWVPRASILLKISRICHSQFKCNYLKSKKLFRKILFHLWNVHQISNILRQKMMVIANVFPKLQTVKNFDRDPLKSAVWEHTLTVNTWKCPKFFQNVQWEHFYQIFNHSQGSWFGECLP